jgi:SAM-dependent methyltransferase
LTSSPDFFGRVAARYHELRPADANRWDLFAQLVTEGDLRGRRVLDVGCGTGRLVAALAERESCKVWGVDRSSEMLEVARARVPEGVGLKQGLAEDLPFKDGWFERAVAQLSLHHWDRPRAFAELRRVVTGRIALATFDPAHFGAFWLNRFFPSIERIDRARFPDGGTLERELRAAGFTETRLVRLSRQTEVSRQDALAKIHGRHISTFDLLDEEEIAEGTARAERELPERVVASLEWLVAVAA